MPEYVPIQDLTIASSVADNDLFPMSDGSGAFAVRGSTIKSYAASDAAAAAADAALSKTAAQSAATAAGNAQTAAETAASSAASAEDVAEDAKDSLDNFKKGKETKLYSADTGVYINSVTGGSGSANGYSTAKTSGGSYRIPIPAGCVKILFDNIIIPSTGWAGWATYSSNTGTETGTFLHGGMSKEISVQENDKYFAVSSAKNGSSYVTSFSVTFIYSELQDDVEDINQRLERLEKVSETVLYSTTQGIYVNYVNGSTGGVANYTAAKGSNERYRIAIPSGCRRIIFNNIWNPLGVGASGWATYSSDSDSEQGSYLRGAQSRFIDVQETDKYFAVSSGKHNGEFVTPISVTYVYNALYGSNKLSNNDFNVVMLGDSIVGSYEGIGSIPYYLSDYIGANCFNGGFPGSSLGADLTSPDPVFEAFNGWKILTAIATNDWSEQQAVIDEHPSLASVFQTHLNTLKNMDWLTVDVITFSWGTNDWGTGVNLLDNPENKKDTTTFGGAFRTGVEALWAVYPQIKIMCCGVIWRGLTISDGQVTGDTDDGKHGRLWYLREYEEKLQDLCKEYHIPFVPMYDNTNMSRYTWSVYFPSSDGTHPNEHGRNIIAKRYAAHLSELAKTI